MTLRRFLAALVAIAFATSGLLHALCGPMAAMADGQVPLCTAAGVTWVPAGDPADPAAPAHDDKCPDCQAGHCGTGFVPPANPAVFAPFTFTTAFQHPKQQTTPTATAWRGAQARAPPMPG